MTTDIFNQRAKLIKPEIERLAYKKLKVNEDAEDLVQEVMLRLWKYREKWATYQDYKPMAYVIFEHCLIDHYRTTIETESIENHLSLAHNENPHTILEEKDTKNYFLKLIEKLPSLQKNIIRMKDIDEYEVEEVAQIANMTINAVHQNLSRARSKVREVYLKNKND